MTTVQITLPDQLAQEAQRAGLLSPELLEKWLRQQLKAQRADQLFSAMNLMSSVDEPAVMSPEAVAEEVAALRAGWSFYIPGKSQLTTNFESEPGASVISRRRRSLMRDWYPAPCDFSTLADACLRRWRLPSFPDHRFQTVVLDRSRPFQTVAATTGTDPRPTFQTVAATTVPDRGCHHWHRPSPNSLLILKPFFAPPPWCLPPLSPSPHDYSSTISSARRKVLPAERGWPPRVALNGKIENALVSVTNAGRSFACTPRMGCSADLGWSPTPWSISLPIPQSLRTCWIDSDGLTGFASASSTMTVRFTWARLPGRDASYSRRGLRWLYHRFSQTHARFFFLPPQRFLRDRL